MEDAEDADGQDLYGYDSMLASVNLNAEKYWHLYKNIIRGLLYGVVAAREAVQSSELGELLGNQEPRLGAGKWNWDNDVFLRKLLLRRLMPAMELYVHQNFGSNWTRLRTLIKNFESPHFEREDDFAWHVTGDAAKQDEEDMNATFFSS